MADTFSKRKRSEIMRRVKGSRNKSTELKLITYFRANKIKGWRRNSNIFGKPDFIFPLNKTAIFVDGCFWHGHNCRNTKPKANKDFWDSKIERNKHRDKKVTKHLKNIGWHVIRIWECELKDDIKVSKKLSHI